MYDLIETQARERIAGMLREAEAHRLVDAAPLRFGPRLPAAFRRSLTRTFFTIARRGATDSIRVS